MWNHHHRNKLAVVVALSLFALVQRAAAQTTPPGKTYVSFGDSYASGPGIDPYNDQSCQRSQYNWPSRLAWRMSLWPERSGPWADYSCLGAKVTGSTCPNGGFANSLKDQIDWAESAGTPAQRTLGSATTLVTISIGGNDSWTSGSTLSLYEALKTCDTPGNCDTTKRLQPADIKWQTLYTNLVPQLQRIRTLAPNATIALVGYPSVIPDANVDNCAGYTYFVQTWSFSPEDQTFLRQLFVAMRDAQQSAVVELNKLPAMANKLKFVDLRPASLGHDICRGSNAWIAPPNSSKPQELHPTHDGMNAFGDVVFGS